MSNLVPMVISREGKNERAMDIFSKMLEERIIYITGTVTSEMSDLVVPQLHYLENQDPNKDISMIINSPGGSVLAGLAIYDTMNFIKCDVSTTVIGQASSMGSFLLSGGAKGKRNSLPSSRIMIHSLARGTGGKIQDQRIQLAESDYLSDYLNKCLAEHTGQTIEEIERATDRDNFMNAEEAVAYGLIDNIITQR